jgi:hypothetical protein
MNYRLFSLKLNQDYYNKKKLEILNYKNYYKNILISKLNYSSNKN